MRLSPDQMMACSRNIEQLVTDQSTLVSVAEEQKIDQRSATQDISFYQTGPRAQEDEYGIVSSQFESALPATSLVGQHPFTTKRRAFLF